MASCSIFLSNAAYLDIVIVDNTQEFTVMRHLLSVQLPHASDNFPDTEWGPEAVS